MKKFSPEDLDQRLATFTLQLKLENLDSVHVHLREDELFLHGSVASYTQKCRIEELALAAGLSVENRLRVIPGVVAPAAIVQPTL